MSTRKLDNNWDWVFCGKQAYIDKTDEIIQNIQTRLKQWKYNCFFDLQAGIDWSYYCGSIGEEDNILSEIQNIVAKTNGVYKINNISSSMNGRTMNIILNIDTIYSINNNIEVII